MRIKLFFLLDWMTALIFFVWLYFWRGFDAALFTALSVFIAFSPICLMLSSFIVLRLATRAFEKEQVKVNNPNAIEELAAVDTVAVPLNRFLTDGDYFVTDLVPEGLSQSSLLAFAATAEQEASHPLGRVIYQTALTRALKIQNISAFHEVPGQGVEALVNNTALRLGNPQWVRAQGVSASAALLTKADQLAVHGKTTLLLGLGEMARGIIALKDDINRDAREFLAMLKRKKIETVLLTASSKKTANNFAKSFSLDAVRANLAPEDKAREVQIMRARGKTVAVVANEFHDLPALVNADVSALLMDGSLTPLNEGGDVHIDFEIPSLEKFLIIHEIASRAAGIIKTNTRLAYLSWILLLPPAMLTALENSPIPFHPIISFTGVLIFSVIIVINSLRMSKK